MIQAISTKKAQGLSITTVIIAAIAIIVLVVMIMIFTGKIKQSSSQIDQQQEQFTGDNCEVPGTPRTCREGNDCTDRDGFIIRDAECDLGVCCSI
jgi:cell division protein FtsN